jgi:tetratricopeptide (TPR) repeat protein
MPRSAHNLVWAAVAGALLASGPAQAQLSPDWNRCVNRDGRSTPDSVFTACSNVISLGKDAKNLAIAYGKRGNAHHDKGEYDRAIADYTRAVELNANDAVVYNNRGIAYRAKGDNDSAIADYTRVTEINPRDAVAYNNRGVAYRAKGNNDSAIADHTKAIELDPELASAYNNRGIAYRAKGDNDSAIADHTKAIDIDPELASAFYNRGLAYRAKGDNDRAFEDATATIEINPRHISAYYSRGLALAAKGNYDRAIADYTKVIEINPKHDGAYQHRSLAYRAKGDDNRAVADHTTAAEIIRKPAAPAAPIEKAALVPSDAADQPFTLVLKTDLGAQRLTVVENEVVVHVWPISSGTRGYSTPTGTFQPKSAHRMWYSRQYDWTPMPYAIFFVRGVAFHGTTAVSRLGRSASHGCIRLATGNAAQLYGLVQKHTFAKTQIIVFGKAIHGSPTVAQRTPAARSTSPNTFANWVKDLFN